MLSITLSNLSIGEPVDIPSPVPCLFCRSLLLGSCPDDSGNSKDNNWHRLWERQNKKSHRQRERLRRLSRDPPYPEDSVVLAHSSGSSDLIAMASNPANQSLEDQFLCWRQDMETKQEEQGKHMTEL